MKEEEQIIDNAISVLMEHFDCVQVLVSRVDMDGNTSSHRRGSGNWYARLGMAHEFINAGVSQDAAERIAREISENPEDGDEWKKIE